MGGRRHKANAQANVGPGHERARHNEHVDVRADSDLESDHPSDHEATDQYFAYDTRSHERPGGAAQRRPRP